jgi:hypothetical protein
VPGRGDARKVLDEDFQRIPQNVTSPVPVDTLYDCSPEGISEWLIGLEHVAHVLTSSDREPCSRLGVKLAARVDQLWAKLGFYEPSGVAYEQLQAEFAKQWRQTHPERGDAQADVLYDLYCDATRLVMDQAHADIAPIVDAIHTLQEQARDLRCGESHWRHFRLPSMALA